MIVIRKAAAIRNRYGFAFGRSTEAAGGVGSVIWAGFVAPVATIAAQIDQRHEW
jgi:hypothetical protein